MDTTTTFAGLRLSNPFVAGASPLGLDLDSIKRLEDSGCAAVVIPSLFEEQVTEAATGRIRHRDPLDEIWSATVSHFPRASDYALGPHEYAAHVSAVKRSVAVPVIASLNGTTGESWLTFSRTIEQAGADALELNLYEIVTDLEVPGAAVEHQLRRAVHELKQILKIPVCVKLSPFFTAFGNVARQLDTAGADGLVLFNRFYQSDVDTTTLAPISRLELSTGQELLLRLRWLAILYGRIRPSLAVTGGVSSPDDGIKALLAGADAIQVVSAVLREGPRYFGMLRRALEQWMERHGFSSLNDFRGRVSLSTTEDPAAFERAHYIRTLQSWNARAHSIRT